MRVNISLVHGYGIGMCARCWSCPFVCIKPICKDAPQVQAAKAKVDFYQKAVAESVPSKGNYIDSKYICNTNIKYSTEM